MKLIFDDTDEQIKKAVNKANQILSNPEFYSAIAGLPQMDNTILLPQHIARVLKNSQQEILIKTYKSWNPFSNLKAKTISKSLIKINTRKFNPDPKKAINILINKSIYAVDMADNPLDFSHSTKYTNGQENSPPWIIGQLAENFIDAQ